MSTISTKAIALTLFAVLAGGEARAADIDDSIWSATFYAGPYTARKTTDVFLHNRFDPISVITALAIDARLFKLGSGFAVEMEAQYVHSFAGIDNRTIAFGLGVRYSNFPWKDMLPTSVALYSGPSFASDPQMLPDDGGPRKKSQSFLNYVGFEVAVGIPSLPHWNLVGRYFHRSGVFGLIANIDEGSSFGLGIRYRL